MALVTREDLSEVLSMPITEARFTALYKRCTAAITTAYSGDLDAPDSKHVAVLTDVCWSILTRLATNPAGAQQVSAGDASSAFTTGASPLLSDDDRRRLEDIDPGGGGRSGRSAFSFSPYRDPSPSVLDGWQ